MAVNLGPDITWYYEPNIFVTMFVLDVENGKMSSHEHKTSEKRVVTIKQ